MSHSYHPSLDGYDERNVLHDGCPECDRRAADPLRGVLELDEFNRLKLWRDMRRAKFGESEPLGRNTSRNDWELIDALYLIAVFMERAGLTASAIEGGLAKGADA